MIRTGSQLSLALVCPSLLIEFYDHAAKNQNSYDYKVQAHYQASSTTICFISLFLFFLFALFLSRRERKSKQYPTTEQPSSCYAQGMASTRVYILENEQCKSPGRQPTSDEHISWYWDIFSSLSAVRKLPATAIAGIKQKENFEKIQN